MQDYSIDTLYDEGYINGEVYYLCDENGISCLADAIKFFEDQNPPAFIESLRKAFYELSEERELSKTVEAASNNSSDTQPKEVTSLQNESLLGQLLRESLINYSVRANSAIRLLRQDFESHSDFFKWVLSTAFNPLRLKNVGRKTYAELKEWKSYIQDYIITHQLLFDNEHIAVQEETDSERNIPQEENSLLQNESFLEHLFKESLESHSVRATNALRAVRQEYNSYSDFFKWVLSVNFMPLDIRNVGRKTGFELKEWQESIQGRLYEYQLSTENNQNVSKPDVKKPVSHWEKSTLFDELFGFFESLKDSRRLVAFHLAQNKIEGLTSIATAINLSKERVRQLVPIVIQDIGKFLKRKRKTIVYTKEEYLDVVNQCQQSLNKEFAIWVGTQVSNEIASIGSYKDYIYKGSLYLMVDADLDLAFDFNSFIDHIESLSSNKYYEETKVSIENIVLECFRHEVKFELLSSITRVCRTILYENYPYHLTEEEIIIPANAYYSIRQRVEDILEKEGSALTVNDIRKKLNETGVEYNGSDNQLVSIIRNSTAIVSYGYPCRFGLVSWGKPDVEEYDSIRDVAIRVLLEQVPHIMVEKELVSLLLAIYTDSSERSIVSNLMADTKQRFGVYLKGKEKYIGLTKERYDPSYVLQIKREARKPTSLSQNKISWQGTFDSVKRVLCTHNWTALDDQQRKWLIANWKKAQAGKLKEWQAVQIFELIETSKKK